MLKSWFWSSRSKSWSWSLSCESWSWVLESSSSMISRQSLFSSYKRRSEVRSTQGGSVAVFAITVTSTFVKTTVSIASRMSGEEAWKLAHAYAAEHYDIIHPLLDKIFCVPASSVPVERVFSCSGTIVRPHRDRIGDDFALCTRVLEMQLPHLICLGC